MYWLWCNFGTLFLHSACSCDNLLFILTTRIEIVIHQAVVSQLVVRIGCELWSTHILLILSFSSFEFIIRSYVQKKSGVCFCSAKISCSISKALLNSNMVMAPNLSPRRMVATALFVVGLQLKAVGLMELHFGSFVWQISFGGLTRDYFVYIPVVAPYITCLFVIQPYTNILTFPAYLLGLGSFYKK